VLAMLDLDFFAEFNGTYGHAMGDRLLEALAGRLRADFGDSTYRISGDEFAVTLPGMSLEQGFLRMEAFRAYASDLARELDVPDDQQISVTIGVAQYPRDAKTVRNLLEAADAALFSAKENNRNQVALPPNEEMVMKSCYYPAASVRKLKVLAERLSRRESHLLREALDDLFRKYDVR